MIKLILITIITFCLCSCGANKVLVKKCSEQDKDGYSICEKV